MKTYIIGRSQFADIVLADASVARRHAELVVTDDRRCHLTDCASGNGTWIAAAEAGGEPRWVPVRQAFVGREQKLRLGDHVIGVDDLLRRAESTPTGEEGGRWRRHGPLADAAKDWVRGRVERDPLSGEIVRKRL